MKKLLSTLLAFGMLFSTLGMDIIPTAAAVFDDSYYHNFATARVTLFMDQSGSSFHLSNTILNCSGNSCAPLSCEVETPDGVLYQRTSCDQNFNTSSNGIIKIYTQYNNEQVTFKYNTSTERFETAYEGQDIIDYGNNNNNNNNNGGARTDLTTDDDTPSLNQSVDLKVRVYKNSSQLDNYFNSQVRFYVYKRNNFDNYVTADSSDYSLVNDRYTFSTSNYGEKNLSDYIYFRTNGVYKVVVTNDYNSTTDEITFVAGSAVCTSCNNTNATSFTVDANVNTLSTNQYVTTYTTAKNGSSRTYDYRGTVKFVVERKDDNSYYRYNASSSDYNLSTTSTYMGSNEQGYIGLSNHLIFYRNGTYRIKAYDNNDSNIYGYREFTVNSSNNNTTNGYFYLVTNDDTPGANNFATLAITARDGNGNKITSYTNRVRFQVYRRTNTSDSWTDITSSYTDNSNYRIYDTSYLFPYNEYGDVELSNFIKFYDSNYDYKVRVTDDNNSNIYGEINFYLKNTNLGGANSSSNNGNNYSTNAYRFVGELYPLVPTEDKEADLKLYVRDNANRTVTNYNRTVRFSVERKTSVGSTNWTSASSSYCSLDRSSYTFSTSDQGYIKLNDLIECKQKGFFRLKIVDDSNNSVLGYIYLTIHSSKDFDTSVSGFTSTQRRAVSSLYSKFMANVNAYEMNNAGLAYDTAWTETWTDLYEKLYEVTYDRSGRELRRYADYVDTINDFNDDFYRLVK